MIPPILLYVRLNRFWLPLPLVLLWPFIFIAWLILGFVPLGLVLSGGSPSQAWQLWLETLRLIGSVRGTRVDIKNEDIYLSIKIV